MGEASGGECGREQPAEVGGVSRPVAGRVGGPIPKRLPGQAGVLYPTRYAWYIIASSLDIMLTDVVLRYFGAVEANTVANRALELFGLWGLVGLKFATVVLVICVCEFVGRRRPKTGRRLAEWAIAISAIPVVISLFQIFLVNIGWLPYEEIRTIEKYSID